jgi:asparagine synthase (glutamine-hydrolysing)
MFPPEQLQALAPGLEKMGHKPPGIPEQTMPDDITRMMLADALIYLPQDILVKVDRASMAHSLESRAPFLDSKVVELAFSLPRNWHRHGMTGKRILSTTFTNMIPNSLWHRHKQGFGVPIHQWFRNGLELKLRSLLSDTNNSFNNASVEALIDTHRQGGRDHGYRLWTIYIYLLWKQQNI